jgi:hypothetical protein
MQDLQGKKGFIPPPFFLLQCKKSFFSAIQQGVNMKIPSSCLNKRGVIILIKRKKDGNTHNL